MRWDTRATPNLLLPLHQTLNKQIPLNVAWEHVLCLITGKKTSVKNNAASISISITLLPSLQL